MKRGEMGFTLLEALIVLAITGVIIWPLAMATTTLLTQPQRSADQNVVLSQVRNAGYWISRDVQMSKTVTPYGPGVFLTLDIPVDSIQTNGRKIDYLFDGSKLKRKEYNFSRTTLISETLIADYIDTSNTTFSAVDVGLYRLTVRAARGEAVVTRSYEVGQRL